MADDTGVWVKVQQGLSTTGGGIYTKVADDGGKWVEIGASSGGGELPGLGGWATITAVSGSYKQPRYEYNDGPNGVGGTDWVAYEFTDDGTLTTSGGLVDALLIGGGSASHDIGVNVKGNAGDVVFGLHEITSGSIVVGKAGRVKNANGGASSIGSTVKTRSSSWGRSYSYSFNPDVGFESDITGVMNYYAGDSQHANYVSVAGDGTSSGSANDGQDGVVIVRVPAAYADNVQETFHGWDSFALVTDGVVTDVTRVPDNEPSTLDAEWLPCDAEVQAGWGHADGEFTPPPAPTRDDLIAELKERIKDLQKDK